MAHVCLGEGTLEAYIRGVDARLGLEEESDAPFVVVDCCAHQGRSLLPPSRLCYRRPVASQIRRCETRRHGSKGACGAPRTSRRRVPSSACGRGGGEANAEARRAARLVWGDGVVSGDASVAEAKQQRPQRRGRPREAHAAAHLRIVPVDAPSTLDQPPELRLVAVVCGLPHLLVPPVWKQTGERTPLALCSGAQHGAPSHAINKREGLRRVVVKMARQSGGSGSSALSENDGVGQLGEATDCS